MPKVSVIIPTYNRQHFVCDAIESILDQTFKDYEIIAVDDGSTDNTRTILQRYGSRIIYIYQENKGLSAARNKGIEAARGEYVAFLDDDDMWLKQKLEKQVYYLDSHPRIGLVHAFSEIIDESGNFLKKETKGHLRFYRKSMKSGYTYAGISRFCMIFFSTAMLRRYCFDRAGVFDTQMQAFEDWDFLLRFSLEYPIGIMPEILVKFRIHPLHTTLNDFTEGRIKVSMKHLAKVESDSRFPLRDKIRHNFYMHLANAYYIDRQRTTFRAYALKAAKLDPFVLFRSRLGMHLLKSLLPLR